MAKRRTRPPIIPEPTDEQLAVDRQAEQENYPTNNFALTALVLVVLIVVIGVAYSIGLIKP